jgi:hypothetical protein
MPATSRIRSHSAQLASHAARLSAHGSRTTHSTTCRGNGAVRKAVQAVSRFS